jgi:hypothetical protein
MEQEKRILQRKSTFRVAFKASLETDWLENDLCQCLSHLWLEEGMEPLQTEQGAGMAASKPCFRERKVVNG